MNKIIKQPIVKWFHMMQKFGFIRQTIVDLTIRAIQEKKIHHSQVDQLYFVASKSFIDDRRSRYSPQRINDIYRTICEHIPTDFSFNDITYLELGSGREFPFALSSIFYLNGAKKVLANDLEALHSIERSPYALYELLVDYLTDKPRWTRHDSTDNAASNRMEAFNLKALRNRDLKSGIKNFTAFEFLEGNFQALDLSPDSIDLITSRSVLEHVMPEIAPLAKRLFQVTSPGGLSVHEVDLRDHRHREKGFNKWSFMLEENLDYKLSNKIRASEIRKNFEDAGFKIVTWEPTVEVVPKEVLANLKGKFKNYDESDISTTIITFCVKKPTL